ncbi:hypothetical protein C4D60_Mb01t23000 [Musa balbisiana]|uniref:Cytochrome P450 family protein n=1 Tax=Musa balbisiana TaxID=52838 RepID=A0A4S8JPK6_MUSBA|nr:hypothetical protein C4D60_Mb01t23000 [Musa balbisiana]
MANLVKHQAYKQQHLQKMTSNKEKERFVVSYVDSLLDIELPEEGGRKLSDNEVVSLCSEFLIGGTDTTSTALQWIMANLVKHQAYKQQHLQKMTSNKEKERFVVSYVDSLLDIELPEEGGRKLSDNEVVSLCSEFLIGGTDTTSTALQWIMANLVKHQAYKQQHLQKMTSNKEKERFVVSYVDSLLDIELPEEGGRKLSDNEVVSLCSEFLIGGTDTTSTALQWIMANLVKHQGVQAKLREEIERAAAGSGGEEDIKQEDLQKMPYLKAVIMESLRRHPPAHFLQRAVTEDVSLCGYLIPREATANFFLAEMNWDEKAWEEPMEFKPERFLGIEGGAVDITGSREIKMMPFGAGRRICPGLGLARLHLQYFVANLVRRFEWKAVEGEEVDLSEKVEFAVVMKNPLRARIIPRRKT